MKTIAVAFLALFLVQIATSITCAKGYIDPGVGTKCLKCSSQYVDCNPTSLALISTISGVVINANVPTVYCPSPSKFNKLTNNCQPLCKLGCATCSLDYDFCTDCSNGFVWNPDHTCIPAVIGLEAASLAILTLGLVFLVISCCLVNKARK